MKFKRSIAFAAIISSVFANSFCAYAEDAAVINPQTVAEEAETDLSVLSVLNEENAEDVFKVDVFCI
ncbi:MAG: hypothetical protein J6A07_00865 [Firmicutes bacterium]|nr:hypothetical protein [Bacillota bacterium]